MGPAHDGINTCIDLANVLYRAEYPNAVGNPPLGGLREESLCLHRAGEHEREIQARPHAGCDGIDDAGVVLDPIPAADAAEDNRIGAERVKTKRVPKLGVARAIK